MFYINMLFLVIFQALTKRSGYPQVETGCTLDNYMGQLETMMIQPIHHGSDMYRFTIGGVAGKNNGNEASLPEN